MVEFQKFPHRLYAFPRLFELKKVRCPGQEIIVYIQYVAEVESRKIRIRQDWVGPDDFHRTLQFVDVHHDGKGPGVIDHLRFIIARTPKHIALSVLAFAKCGSCKEFKGPGDKVSEGR